MTRKRLVHAAAVGRGGTRSPRWGAAGTRRHSTLRRSTTIRPSTSTFFQRVSTTAPSSGPSTWLSMRTPSLGHLSPKSLKISVPKRDDPDGGYAGGAFVAQNARDLSGYNALTFWAKASRAEVFDVVGFANDNTGHIQIPGELGQRRAHDRMAEVHRSHSPSRETERRAGSFLLLRCRCPRIATDTPPGSTKSSSRRSAGSTTRGRIWPTRSSTRSSGTRYSWTARRRLSTSRGPTRPSTISRGTLRITAPTKRWPKPPAARSR